MIAYVILLNSLKDMQAFPFCVFRNQCYFLEFCAAFGHCAHTIGQNRVQHVDLNVLL